MNTIVSLAYIKQSQLSLWEPRQNDLRNPDVYWEPCQTPEIECFEKNNLFVKHSILDVSKNSEYASVICYYYLGNLRALRRLI